MHLRSSDKFSWLISQGNAATNPLLPEPERLQAAVQHYEALERLDTVSAELATKLIKGFAAQIPNFLMTASDPSEPAGVRQYIIHFTHKNGLHHISHSAATQITSRPAFMSAAFSIAETAAQNIDLGTISQAMLKMVTEPSEDIEVRRDAALLHVLATLHERYGFRQPPPANQDAINLYRDIAP